ncbi:MAG: RHS repeat-associated core domain-containing protein [Pirellulales bacterium]|nr:RHS repeat-associated core domain-containing protein [Pirellulales bacterium]
MTIDGIYYTGRDRDYGYDSRGQLTSVVETIPTPFTVTTQTYAYDKNGNRTATNGVAATIGANNRLTNDGTYSYTYDDEGNLLSRTTIATGVRREYAWDHRNRLAAVVHRPSVGGAATAVEFYAYDVFNRRVRRDLDTNGDLNPESRELYVYDGDDVLLDFTDADANGAALPALARRYLHGPAVDQVLAQENVGGETYWLLGDHLNSTHDLVRWDAGTGRTVVAGHQVYDAFGTPVDQAYLTRYQFTGREYDSATGQQYNRARWYSPHAGRWMSEDPIGFAARDANLSRYVGNQPTNYSDPTGKFWPIIGGVIAGIIYLLDPNNSNAPGPGDGTLPDDPHGGLPAATAAGLGVGLGGSMAGGVLGKCTVRATEKAVAELATKIQFTATTARHMAEAGRYVPRHILAQAILHGQRMADPQGAAGAVKIVQEVCVNGKIKTLEIIWREADNMILHFLYK